MWLRFRKQVSNFMFGKKEMKIMMVGLVAAGKTTIIYMLKLGQVVNTNRTVGFEVETLEYNDIKFTVWELGGQLRYKLDPLWRHVLPNTHGLIFVVDSTDRDRVEEAKDDLHNVLNKDELPDVVLLVFANKQDLPNAMTNDEITEKLDLNSITQCKWYIQSTCAISGDGLHEGLDWLCNNIDSTSV